jgi:hypothetical protein
VCWENEEEGNTKFPLHRGLRLFTGLAIASVAAVTQFNRSSDEAECAVIMMQAENETGFPAESSRSFRLRILEI